MTPRFSIALATRNGARYLEALLDSLVAQLWAPYELVVSDDASEDSTTIILETFSARAPFPVRLLRNPQPLGVEGNFSCAIAACAGDCIALADQDDLWRPEKLARLARALMEPGTLAVFSDAEVVDAKLVPLGYTMWQRVNFTVSEQVRLAQGDGFAVLLKHRIVTGATLAFRVSLREAVLPIPSGWPHDAWFALIAAANGGLSAVSEPLISYRQHENNAVGGIRKLFLQEARSALMLDRKGWYRRELDLWHNLDARLQALPVRTSALVDLSEKIAHLEARSNLPAARWRRLPGVLGELVSGRYTRYARNWGSAAIDLLVR